MLTAFAWYGARIAEFRRILQCLPRTQIRRICSTGALPFLENLLENKSGGCPQSRPTGQEDIRLPLNTFVPESARKE